MVPSEDPSKGHAAFPMWRRAREDAACRLCDGRSVGARARFWDFGGLKPPHVLEPQQRVGHATLLPAMQNFTDMAAERCTLPGGSGR